MPEARNKPLHVCERAAFMLLLTEPQRQSKSPGVNQAQRVRKRDFDPAAAVKMTRANSNSNTNFRVQKGRAILSYNSAKA